MKSISGGNFVEIALLIKEDVLRLGNC